MGLSWSRSGQVGASLREAVVVQALEALGAVKAVEAMEAL